MKRQDKVWVMSALPPYHITLRYILPPAYCPSREIVPESPLFVFYDFAVAWKALWVLNDLLTEERERIHDKE